ncbi:hypothetical protein [Pseudarthrobacter sp. YAF2]|uniref:hypothetical protein n=1 Tax=Pseudarthrobacter sp. YAF2 TaxID=3233078 RepID=UPI003F9B3A39
MPPNQEQDMSPSDPKDRHEMRAAKNAERILFPTVTGELHSYSREELGIVTASSHPQVRSAGGFLVMAVVLAAVAVFSILLVAGPTSRGQDPMWSALFLTATGVGGAVYALRMAKVASRAKRLRAERGNLEPSARQLDCDQDQHGQA